jgi:hypothetical protein
MGEGAICKKERQKTHSLIRYNKHCAKWFYGSLFVVRFAKVWAHRNLIGVFLDFIISSSCF